jgi:putative acetyltransferase
MDFVPIEPHQDAAMAAIIRAALKAHGLDIPGTAYFDEALDHLSVYYDRPGRAYYVLLEDGAVTGGVGLAEFEGLPGCCELQKLYLSPAARGRGLGYRMIRFIEDRARALGYRQIYLETHTNLQAAIHEYERSGYRQIPRPAAVIHTTMDRFYIKEL